MQGDSREEIRKALQILAGEDESPRSNTHSYSIYFINKMDPEKKRKLSPLKI